MASDRYLRGTGIGEATRNAQSLDRPASHDDASVGTEAYHRRVMILVGSVEGGHGFSGHHVYRHWL